MQVTTNTGRQPSLPNRSEVVAGFENLTMKAEISADITDMIVPPRVSNIKLFAAKYPVLAELYFFAHLFAIPNIAISAKGAVKQIKKVVNKPKPAQKFDASMKMTAHISKIFDSFVILVVGLEALETGKWLAEIGFKWGAQVYKAIGSCLDKIALVAIVLATAQAVVEARRAWKTRKVSKEFNSQPWMPANQPFTTKEAALFKEYMTFMPAEELKKLGKHLGVDGEQFKKRLLERMSAANPTPTELKQLERDITLIKGKLKTTERMHVVSSISTATYVAASVCTFFPPLHPVAAMLFIASAVTRLTKTIFGQMKQYQFEEHFKLIERPAGAKSPSEMNKGEKVWDFMKWQAGWYQEQSLLRRIVKVGASGWQNGIHIGLFVATMCKAVRATGVIFRF